MVIHVGTSGWQYRHWRGDFYPAQLPQRAWLEYYTENFGTVELNNAFYRLPERAAFEQWRSRTPDNFIIAVKASRYLTHLKRLREPAEPVHRLLARMDGLGDRLGPVLLQLPPAFPVEKERLIECLCSFPREIRLAVEFRDNSWWTDEIREILAYHNAAWCWADRGGLSVGPTWVTSDWGYVRMHEGPLATFPHYDRETLRAWIQRISRVWSHSTDVFVYFNNDAEGAAPRDARLFADIAAEFGPTSAY